MTIRVLAERLDLLLGRDVRSRWRIIAISALCVAAIGLTAESTGASVRIAQLSSTSIGACVFLLQIGLYIISPHVVWERVRVSSRIYMMRSAAGLAASGVLAIVASLSAPEVEAAFLNRRLKIAFAEDSATHRLPSATQRIFTDALFAPVQLRRDLVERATSEVRKQSSKEAWQAFVAILNYTVNRRGIADEGALKERLEKLESLKYAPLCGPSNLSGSAISAFTVNNGVPDLQAFSALQEISSCRLVLDGQKLAQITMSSVIVEYQGGPVVLKNVAIVGVLFNLPNDTPNVRRFADAVLQAKDNLLTIRIE